jgi:hypothetical protein
MVVAGSMGVFAAPSPDTSNQASSQPIVSGQEPAFFLSNPA